MSGIYGFSCTAAAEADLQQTMGGLEYWNRIYGRQDHGQTQIGQNGIGCHLEHFSDHFPMSAPIIRDHGRFAVVDALLYNRDELLSGIHLEHDSRLSDEELLLHWIEVKGFDSLAQVNGDFAGAIFDPETGEWTLFRDHLGVRPLYLYRDKDFFAFSTDIRGLLALPQVDAHPNEMRLYKDLIHQSIISLLETEYAHIRFVRPAAVTRVRLGSTGFELTERIYWKLRSKRIRLGSDTEYQQELRRLITDSVSRRLDAIPGIVGAELSGGLDSGVIDILINRFGREGRYVSWSPSPDSIPLRDGDDERHVINDVCRQEHIECSYLRAKDKLSFKGLMDRAVPPHFDTPNLGYGAAWIHNEGARVVFTGHGGDEGVSHRCNRLEPLVYGEFGSFFKLYWDDLRGNRLRFLKVFKSMYQDIRRIWKKVYNPATAEELDDPIFTEDFRRKMKASYKDRLMTFSFDPVKYVMQGGTQHRLDNAAYQGAYHDVRYVYPFVDYRVIDYALSIPRVQYLGKQNRRIYREAFRDILPDSLYYLGYKDFASKRDIKRSGNYHQEFQSELNMIASSLDPEVWGEILDMDRIRTIKPSEDENSLEDMIISRKVNQLKRLILIQNAREKALKWREFDEQNILL